MPFAKTRTRLQTAFLKHLLKKQHPKIVLRNAGVKGVGLFAKNPIKKGQIVLDEKPYLYFPRFDEKPNLDHAWLSTTCTWCGHRSVNLEQLLVHIRANFPPLPFDSLQNQSLIKELSSDIEKIYEKEPCCKGDPNDPHMTPLYDRYIFNKTQYQHDEKAFLSMVMFLIYRDIYDTFELYSRNVKPKETYESTLLPYAVLYSNDDVPWDDPLIENLVWVREILVRRKAYSTKLMYEDELCSRLLGKYIQNALPMNRLAPIGYLIQRQVPFLDLFIPPQNKTQAQRFKSKKALYEQIIQTLSMHLEYPQVRQILESEGEGLFPVFSLINHNCIPNIEQDTTAHFKTTWIASRDIEQGEEIVRSYVDNIKSLIERRDALAAYNIVCTCKYCFPEK